MTDRPPGNDDLTWPADEPPVERPVPDGYEFTLLLTHDIDRPYKTYQSLYYALTQPDRRRYHLSTLRPGVNPYWRFEDLMALESDLGVRSACYVLSEQHLFRDRPVSEWLTRTGWKLFAGRYDPTATEIREVIVELDEGGWEIGLHGSYESFDDCERLDAEKSVIESVLGHPIRGARQHYLNLRTPDTWAHQRALGLRYDASLGTSAEYGFRHGYGIRRPFDDEFVVFPLTVMEQSLPDPGDDFDAAWAVCEDLLREARDNDAVMSVLWHLRHFAKREFPGYRRIYRRLVERAKDLGAWVGSPGDFYELMDLDDPPNRRERGDGGGGDGATPADAVVDTDAKAEGDENDGSAVDHRHPAE